MHICFSFLMFSVSILYLVERFYVVFILWYLVKSFIGT